MLHVQKAIFNLGYWRSAKIVIPIQYYLFQLYEHATCKEERTNDFWEDFSAQLKRLVATWAWAPYLTRVFPKSWLECNFCNGDNMRRPRVYIERKDWACPTAEWNLISSHTMSSFFFLHKMREIIISFFGLL